MFAGVLLVPVSPDLPSVRLNDDVSFSSTLYCKNLFNNNSNDEDDKNK